MRQFKQRKWIAPLLLAVLVLGVWAGGAVAADRTEALFSKLRGVYNLVEAMHKDGADVDKFVDGAIKGGLEALGDPYTNYFDGTEYQGFLDSLNGTFTGIGAYLEQGDKYVVISSPIKETPAARAGLKSGDRILEVNGASMLGASTEKAVQMIRGPEGTTVELKIERPSESKIITLKITRAVISVPEVESKMLDGEVGYIQITSFGDNATDDFYRAVEELKAQGAKALVLDLRQNPGGYVDDAVAIASAFVPAGEPVVWEVGRDGKEALRSTGRLINLPVSVLVDNGSASASEILSGAIQDYGIGPLVGTKTFGKGTVQQILSLVQGGGLKVTVAEYLTAKEHHVHHIGLTPDYVVDAQLETERLTPLALTRPLSLASFGDDVQGLQDRLAELGYQPDRDGFFGVKTGEAVVNFAKDNWLEAVPEVDLVFVQALNRRLSNRVKEIQEKDIQLDKAMELVRAKLAN